MKITYVVSILILAIFLLSVVAFFSYRASYAYFTDAVVSTRQTFIAASDFSSVGEDESGSVVINEVSILGDGSSEWIELFNLTDQNVDVSGWKIEDNTSLDTFSDTENLVIPTGGYVLVVAENTTVEDIPSGILVIETTGAIGNGLANSGDRVILRDPDENIVDEMSYGNDDSVFFDIDAPSSGETLQRIPNGEDNDSADDWQVGTPSIGGENL